jgi:hypothetical protein
LEITPIKQKKSLMKTTLLLFLALLASFTATGQAANIPITYLPFTINSPGTYVLQKDLTANANSFAISMAKPVGAIVLDLNGHTLHAIPVPFPQLNTTSHGILVHLNGGAAGGITIRNGTLEGFAYGIETSSITPDKNSDLLIQNVTFKNDLTSSVNSVAIHLVLADSATISGCKFVGAGHTEILDEMNETGLTLNNLSFDGTLVTNIQENAYKGFPQTVVNFYSYLNFSILQ